MEQLEQVYQAVRVDRFIVKLKAANPEKSLFSAVERESIWYGERGELLQLVTLPQKVNPSEYADILRSNGLVSQIEYITPDYLMEYAGFTLSYIEIGPQEGISNGQENEADDQEPDAKSGQTEWGGSEESDDSEHQNGANNQDDPERQDDTDGTESHDGVIGRENEESKTTKEGFGEGEAEILAEGGGTEEDPINLTHEGNEEIIS